MSKLEKENYANGFYIYISTTLKIAKKNNITKNSKRRTIK